jgi:putative transposase
MARIKEVHGEAFKAKVALESVRGDLTANQIGSRYGVHPTLVNRWRKELIAGAGSIFSPNQGIRSAKKVADHDKLVAELFEQIGKLKMELEWLKKNSSLSTERKRSLIDESDPVFSVSEQCRLLNLARSSYYHAGVGESEEDLVLKRHLDRIYTDLPFFGSRKMVVELAKLGFRVCRKKVRRLMREMGIWAIYPKPRLSENRENHRKYPYLLNNFKVEEPGQVWAADITYIPMREGFMYLAATLDWYSRYVVSWKLSNSLESSFCLEMLEEALSMGNHSIFNTDQGVQFTSNAWIGAVEGAGVRVSMDGKGRCFDNIFVERLWRTVKCEDVYPRGYGTPKELQDGLKNYFRFCNERRPHQSLGNKSPAEFHRMNGSSWARKAGA